MPERPTSTTLGARNTCSAPFMKVRPRPTGRARPSPRHRLPPWMCTPTARCPLLLDVGGQITSLPFGTLISGRRRSDGHRLRRRRCYPGPRPCHRPFAPGPESAHEIVPIVIAHTPSPNPPPTAADAYARKSHVHFTPCRHRNSTWATWLRTHPIVPDESADPGRNFSSRLPATAGA